MDEIYVRYIFNGKIENILKGLNLGVLDPVY